MGWIEKIKSVIEEFTARDTEKIAERNRVPSTEENAERNPVPPTEEIGERNPVPSTEEFTEQNPVPLEDELISPVIEELADSEKLAMEFSDFIMKYDLPFKDTEVTNPYEWKDDVVDNLLEGQTDGYISSLREISERVPESKVEAEKIIEEMNAYNEPHYRIFTGWDDYYEACAFQEETGWRQTGMVDYNEAIGKVEDWVIVYRDIEDLPPHLQNRTVACMEHDIKHYQNLAELPADKMVHFEEVSRKQLQAVHDTASAWLHDYESGWISNESGEFKELRQGIAGFIAQYEEEINIPMKERVICCDENNGDLQPSSGITKEHYLEAYKNACLYRDAEESARMEIDYDISRSGFRETETLVENIRKFSKMEGKNYTIKELAELNKSKPDFKDNPQKKECFEQIVKEFQEQEIENFNNTPHFLKQEMLMEQSLMMGA